MHQVSGVWVRLGVGLMIWRIGKPIRVFARGTSLRRRVAYSLAVVRLILVPVILLAVYYLFRMGLIVDRIVSVDAPVATMADQASIQMMEARRDEQDYFLSHDPAKLQANRQTLAGLVQLIGTIRDLQPAEHEAARTMLDQVKTHQALMDQAVASLGHPGQAPVERVERVVRAYEHDLDNLLRRDRHENRGRLIDDLRGELGSFDGQINGTLEAEDPALRDATAGLQSSSDQVRQLASDVERRSWERVMTDHQDARALMHRAEWVLILVSSITLILSVLVSFILPRAVVKPLADLKQAVDQAATGDYEIEFDVRGEGEIVQLAGSLRRLIAHVREMTMSAGVGARH